MPVKIRPAFVHTAAFTAYS